MGPPTWDIGVNIQGDVALLARYAGEEQEKKWAIVAEDLGEERLDKHLKDPTSVSFMEDFFLFLWRQDSLSLEETCCCNFVHHEEGGDGRSAPRRGCFACRAAADFDACQAELAEDLLDRYYAFIMTYY